MRENDKWKDGCPASTFKETTKYEKGKWCNLEDVKIEGSLCMLHDCGTWDMEICGMGIGFSHATGFPQCIKMTK
jgi:hypothetical protein